MSDVLEFPGSLKNFERTRATMLRHWMAWLRQNPDQMVVVNQAAATVQTMLTLAGLVDETDS